MLEYAPMLHLLYYAQNYAGIIHQGQFRTSSASLSTVESHCLLYIPTVIRFSQTVNVMGEYFANEIFQRCGKVYEVEGMKLMGQTTFTYSDVEPILRQL